MQRKARPTGLKGVKLVRIDGRSEPAAASDWQDGPHKPLKRAKRRGVEAAYRICVTEQCEEDLAMIGSDATRSEVARAINGLAKGPEVGKRSRYLAGLDMLRAGRGRFVVVVKVVESSRTVTVLAVVPARKDSATRLMKPFSVTPKLRRTAAEREYLKQRREEERKFGELLDEEIGKKI